MSLSFNLNIFCINSQSRSEVVRDVGTRPKTSSSFYLDTKNTDSKCENADKTHGNTDKTDGNTDKADLDKKIIRQIEYYFGDFNLPKDQFMRELMEEENGERNIFILPSQFFIILPSRLFVCCKQSFNPLSHPSIHQTFFVCSYF